MSEEIKAVAAEIKIEDAVLIASIKVDVMDILEDMALKTENTIDDMLVQIVKSARDGLDWKGLAKELL